MPSLDNTNTPDQYTSHKKSIISIIILVAILMIVFFLYWLFQGESTPEIEPIIEDRIDKRVVLTPDEIKAKEKILQEFVNERVQLTLAEIAAKKEALKALNGI